LTIQVLIVPVNNTGTVTITSTPSGAGFHLAGPGLTHYDGTTPTTLTGEPVGTYTVTWDILLGGYDTPGSQTNTLLQGSPISFDANYNQSSKPPATVRTPPYDFFNGCNSTSSLILGDSIVSSNPASGGVSVNVRSTGDGTASAQAGVGILYTPTFTGSVRLKATVQIGPAQSFDVVTLLGFPVGTDTYEVGGGTIGSLVFITATSVQGQSATGTTVFREANMTADNTPSPLPSVIRGSTHQYNPAETYSAEMLMPVSEGVRIGVCAGVKSQVATVSLVPLPFFVMAKALYTASVVEFDITPQ
jgi:hypothetical protein